MKTAVSIPDDVFADAERLARRLKTSRSHLYSRALKEYVVRHDADHITDALNAICEEEPSSYDAFAKTAAQRALRNSEW